MGGDASKTGVVGGGCLAGRRRGGCLCENDNCVLVYLPLRRMGPVSEPFVGLDERICRLV